MTSMEEQKKSWRLLCTNIVKIVDSTTNENLEKLAYNLFQENLIRGRGILARAIINQIITTGDITPLAALVCLVNLSMPQTGEILVARCVTLWKKWYLGNDIPKTRKMSCFLAQLITRRVVEDVLALQMLQVMLENGGSEASIHLATEFLNVVGSHLDRTSKTASSAVYDQLRLVVQENRASDSTKREILRCLELRRTAKHPYIRTQDADEATHFVDLTDLQDPQSELNVFQYDPDFAVADAAYNDLKNQVVLNMEARESEARDNANARDTAHDPSRDTIDMTDAATLQAQKTIYLTIMSSMSADEAVHKLLRLKADDAVVADMVVKSCLQEKTYSKYFGVIGEKLCGRGLRWQRVFVDQFREKYDTCYQFEGPQLRNIGRFFGHLIAADKLDPCTTLGHITLTETHTTSSSRVFIKFLFQELVEELGVVELKSTLTHRDIRLHIQGLFPESRADTDHLMFSINYFTAIGLGVLTEDMRLVLDSMSRGRSPTRSLGSYSRSESYSRLPSREGRLEST